jgi:hypothetical protein
MELKIGNVSLPLQVDEKQLANFILKNLFCAPEPGMIFTIDANNRPCLAGVPLNATEVIYWKERLHEFISNPIWNLLSHTLVEQSRKYMFENAKTLDDMVFGKAMLYVVDMQQQILKIIGGISIPVPPEMVSKRKK